MGALLAARSASEIIVAIVQHSCSRCGAEVDNSLPYCPACEAPQVRFLPRESAEEIVRLHAAAAPLVPVLGPSPGNTPNSAAAANDRARFLRAAIYAGAIGSLISTLPFAFLVGLPLAGVLAVRFYRRGPFFREVPPRAGFRLGALSGVLAFAMLVVVRTVSVAASGGGRDFRQGLVEAVHRAQATNPDPQVQQVFQFFLTQQGLTVLMVLSLVFTGVAFLLMAGLGGLVSASISRRRVPR